MNTSWRYLAVIGLVFLSGCEQNQPELLTGKQLYEYYCAGCHQKTGVGKVFLGVPGNKDTDLPDYQIAHKIRGTGERSTDEKMPVFENLTAQEAAKISAYLKTLK